MKKLAVLAFLALSMLAARTTLSLYALVDTALMGVASACAFGFFIFLSPQGEEVQVNLPAYGPESEKRLLLHLDALNRTLLKASRK
jgi:hypothetical protein